MSEIQKIQNFTYTITEGRPFFIYELLQNIVNIHYRHNEGSLGVSRRMLGAHLGQTTWIRWREIVSSD